MITRPVNFEDAGDLKAERTRWVREQVKGLLHEPLSEHGEIGNSRGNNVTSTPTRGNAESYTIRRLKRDHPALADKKPLV